MLSGTDATLLRQIQSGSLTAFEILVKRYQQKLYIFAYRITHNHEDAQEIVQDAFVSVYKHVDKIDPNQKFSSYIFKVTKNIAISCLRKRRVIVPLYDIVMADEDEDLFAAFARAEGNQTLNRLITAIGKKYRIIIRLYYFDELSYEEISRKLDLPLNTVRTHLRRAKAAVKRLLAYEKI